MRLLDDFEGRASDFFYNEASPRTGMVRDRASNVGLSPSRVSVHRRHRLWSDRSLHRPQAQLSPPVRLRAARRENPRLPARRLPPRARLPLPLHRYGKRPAHVRLRALLHRHLLAPLRHPHLPSVFFRQCAHRSPRYDLLPPHRLGMDAQRRPDPLHGLAARSGLPQPSLGYLLRAARHVPAGHRLAHASHPRQYLERSAAPRRPVRRHRLHQRRRPHLHSPVRSRLVRPPQHRRPPCQLLHQLHRRHPRAPAVVPHRGPPLSLVRSKSLGRLRIRFARGLPRLGWSALHGAARWHARPQRRRRLTRLPAR